MNSKRPATSYEILNVAPDAPQAIIHAAYRKLARQLHPDLQPETHQMAALRNFQALQAAYDKIKTPESRKAYNHWLATRTRAILIDQTKIVNDSGKPFKNFLETLETIFWPIERNRSYEERK